MEFNLSKIFKESFGYDAPEMSKFNIPQASPRVEMSSLGQPYFETDAYGREFFLPVKLDKYLVPFAVIGMKWSKNFIDTPMSKRGGTVHELINIADYEFTIKGIFISKDNRHPESEIIDFRNIFIKNESVQLRSVLTDIVLQGQYNHSVIIKEMSFPSNRGVEHAQPFTIEAKRDCLYFLIKKTT